MSAAKKTGTMLGILTVGVILAAGLAPSASATPVHIKFSGAAGTGTADLTLAPDPHASSLYQPTYNAADGANNVSPPLSSYDPAGAAYITGASGSFNGVAITGVMPTNQGAAPPGEVLPNSFSWIYTASGQYSYDNLFYANGSPLVCPPESAGGGLGYPFSGGFLDIYGVMFALQNGDYVGLWSDGVTTPGFFGPSWPGGLTYGINIFTPTATTGIYALSASSQFAGVTAEVPEPADLGMFGLGVLLIGVFAGLRRRYR